MNAPSSRPRQCGTRPAPATLALPYRPPFDWPLLLAFLSARAIDGIETCHDGRYRRSLRVDLPGLNWCGRICVTDHPEDQCVVVDCEAAPEPVLANAAARLRRLFDLDADPAKIATALGPLAAGRPGLRLPGAVNGFEIAVRAVLGQQVSIKSARTLAGRFVARFGDPLDPATAVVDPIDPGRADPTQTDPTQTDPTQTESTQADPLQAAPSAPSPTHGFPRPEVIAELPLDTDRGDGHALTALGLPGQRARTLITLAQALVERRIVLDADVDAPVDPAATIAALEALPGIGPWTAQYIAMRALSWHDAFPASDLGVMKALGTRRPREAIARAEAWRPWRAYAVIHLWAGGRP